MKGALLHIVLFELVENACPAKIAEITGMFYRCKQEIPGVNAVSVSRNFSESPNAADWTFSVVIELENEAALDPYVEHPHHKAIGRVSTEGFAAKVVVFDHKLGSEPDLGSDPVERPMPGI